MRRVRRNNGWMDNGPNVCDNGFKLPLAYLNMFVPLLLSGVGKPGLDHLIARKCAN